MSLYKFKNTLTRHGRSYRSLLNSALGTKRNRGKHVYISFHKCGTQYTMGFLRKVCEYNQLDWHKVDWRRELKKHHVLGSDFIFLSDYSSVKNSPFKFSDKIKCFVVFRDPRDVLVSMYFSHRYSHAENAPEIASDRQTLEKISMTQGLNFLLDNSSYFKRMMIELEKLQAEQDDLLFVRFEDLVKNPVSEFDGILKNIGLGVTPELLEKIDSEINFDILKSKTTKSMNDKPGHYRSGKSGGWVNHFDEDLKARFKSIYGQQLIDLGYEKSLSW